jgi:hypothetical protein
MPFVRAAQNDVSTASRTERGTGDMGGSTYLRGVHHLEPVLRVAVLSGSELFSDTSSRVVFVSPGDGGDGVAAAAWFMRVRTYRRGPF